MNKVFLVSPSLQVNTQLHNAKDNSYSLGLAYLHAVIEKAGYFITTRNYNSTDMAAAEEEIVSELKTFDPDFLLIQIFTMNRVASYRIIQQARKIKQNIKIIVGGVHASIRYKQLLENFPVDYVVIGEGEITVVELLDSLAHGGTAFGVMGVAYKDDDQIVKNPDRELIANLDDLPFPRHDLFIGPDREMACILTSRGCPFKCSFCCLFTISRRKFRRRSVNNVVDEIEYILENFKNIKVIQLADDTFTLDHQRAIDFCKEIIKRNIKVKFWCSARIKPASEELFELMQKAGFTRIGFGLETGSAKLLKSIHKNITREDVIKTFGMLRDRKKIDIYTYLMVGFPGENGETVNETIDLVKRLQKIRYYVVSGAAPLWVYPNTEVYDVMQSSGLIDDSYWLTDKDVPFFTVEHTEEELAHMSLKISIKCMPIRERVKLAVGEMLLHPGTFAKQFMARMHKLRNFWLVYWQR